MCGESRRWHFGVLSFTGTGHLNPLIALSHELQQRGHRVTFFEKAKIEERVRHAGLEFVAIGKEARSPRSAPAVRGSGLYSQLRMLRFNLQRIRRDLSMYLAELPPVLTHAGVDALIINEIALTGPTIAEFLRLPWFVISTSVPHNFGWKAYPWFAGYRYSNSLGTLLEVALLENSAMRMRGPIRRSIDGWRRQAGLGPLRATANQSLAQITPMPACMDLPRRNLPANFYYTAPFVAQGTRLSVPFPWERLNGKPLIYVTLGTTRNLQPLLFRIIAEGCAGLGVQLVISLGNRLEPEQVSGLPGEPIVVKFAPQLELLRRARILITHAGPNTVFEALREGRPMVAIPIAYDQPAIARRLERLGVAEVLPVARLSAQCVRAAVAAVLSQPDYHEAAAKVQHILEGLDGPARAADIIEEKLADYTDRAQEADAAAALISTACH